MEIVFFGTGTSHGVPVIGCECDVCKSTDFRDKRTRSSILIKSNSKNILIDTSIDFRIQALANDLKSLDAVLYTHTHADHLFGLDDVRPLTKSSNLQIYCDSHSEQQILSKFDYVFGAAVQKGGGLPKLKLNCIEDLKSFNAGGVEFLPVPIYHGKLKIYGYRFGDVAYLTDCSSVPQESAAALEGVRLLIIDALKYTPHPTHFSVEQAIDFSRKIKAEQTYFTHMAHDLKHSVLDKELPENISPAYDNLRLQL
jgi:phosphoribosyl 1,2-cyclic phosphate phosphodiesterase